MSLKSLAAVGLSATAMLAGTAAAQAAATSVTTAIRSQDKAVRHNPAVKALAHFHANSPAQARKLIPEFEAASKAVNHAATVVSRASTSSAMQRAGQKDWVDGARELAHGFEQLTVALRDVERGDKTAAKREAVTAIKTIKAGDTLGTKGDRLLDLPSND
jgi:dihydroxyacetone kinase-like predicted kinase